MITPEAAWPVDSEYKDYYDAGVAGGRQVAKDSDAVIVAIARNAMPAIGNTMLLSAAVASGFRSCQMFVFENDSDDDTSVLLDAVAADHGNWFTVRHETLGGVDARGFEPERTVRLAYCRQQCLEWVRANAGDTSWTIVLDTDPAGGFSVDGVFNSVYRIAERLASHAPMRPGGMASYSLWRVPQGIAHYDAWAARPNWWRDRRSEVGFQWFSSFFPPVGSPPIAMNSAFGGLAVYRTEAFLAGGYSGEDCEHVTHHKRMHEAGYQMYLNPGSRYIAVWENDDEASA